MTIALILFVLMYLGMLIFPKWRVAFAVGGAVCMLAFGVLPIGAALPAINWNVILMIAGTMGLVSLFIETGMPARLADLLLQKAPNACWAIVLLAMFAGVVSAFVDNVATVLMVAPVGIAISRKLKVDPVPVIIAIAVSSNLQGAATLVGDTTSILLGGYAGMDFIDFFWYKGEPGMFFAVELGAVISALILLLGIELGSSPNNEAVMAESATQMGRIAVVTVVMAPMVEEPLFRGLLFGGVSGMLYAFCGGALSLAVMSVLVYACRSFGTVGVGIAGAVSHNVGQVLAAMLVLQTNRLVYYMGVLVLVGIATGAATGTLAALLMKHIPPAIAAKVKRERKKK